MGAGGGALWFGRIIPKRDFVGEGVPNKKTREESVWGSAIGGAVAGLVVAFSSYAVLCAVAAVPVLALALLVMAWRKATVRA